MNIYVIKDTRNEKNEGLPSYVSGGSETTHSLYLAKRWTNKKEALSAAREWKKLMDYESDLWITVERHRFSAGVFKIV